jgi:1-acyl-sn-glycerol-3-phosphate acyltransferase
MASREIAPFMMRYINQALAVLALFLATIWSVICAILAVIGFLTYRPLGVKAHQYWGLGWCALLGIRLRIDGLEKLPPNGVLAPNHESMFDIIALACLPIHYRWISKESVGRIPFIGWAMKAMGCFFVKRDRSGHDLNVMAEVEQALRDGAMVIIFPEGTRSRSGELLPFKKGAFKTSINAEAPLIPIAISGTREITPPGGIPQKRGYDVCIKIGDPYLPKRGDAIEPLMAQFRKQMETLLGHP